VEGLAELVDADVWIWTQGRLLDGAPPMAFGFIDGSREQGRSQTLLLQLARDAEWNALCQDPMKKGFRGHLTRSRGQLVSDDAWYGSRVINGPYGALGFDDFVMSLYDLGEGAYSAIGVWRLRGRPPLDERQRCVIHAIVGQVDWLHRAGVDVPAAPRVQPLGPRLRQVLLLLLGGDSRKQVAGKLKLSEHTVTDYIKALYRHFGVSSRAELLAQFLSGDAVPPG
jgi:DNA-binding CsgD family transcriptional regulator